MRIVKLNYLLRSLEVFFIIYRIFQIDPCWAGGTGKKEFQACENPWMLDSSIPACPDGSNTVLPENYPAGAYVISNQEIPDPYISDSPGVQSFYINVAMGILRNSGERTPFLLFPTTPTAIHRLKQTIQESQVDQKTKNRWLASIRHIGTKGVWSWVSSNPSFTWYQDIMAATYDRSTGAPKIRKVNVYNIQNANLSYDGLMAELENSCHIHQIEGPPLTQVIPETDPQSGGNIIGLPGGLCIHSDTQPFDYTRQYCPNRRDHVPLKTSWLKVGHADELVKVVKKPTPAPPCDFSITVSSPRAAIHALKTAPKEKFFQFNNSTDEAIEEKLPISESPFLSFCVEHSEELLEAYIRVHGAPPPASSPGEDEKSNAARPATSSLSIPRESLKTLVDEIYPKFAFAGIIADDSSEIREFCHRLTNDVVANALEKSDSRFAKYNAAIQLEMDRFNKMLTTQLNAQLPQCKADVVELPDLFFGGTAPNGKLSRGLGQSILPGPANSLSVENTQLVPDPLNSAFRDFIQSSYKNRNIKTEFVDTYFYSHYRGGNVHCATKMVPFCRPTNVEGK